jgi:hypothetical protein
MKALKKTLLVIGALVAIFCIFAIATYDPKKAQEAEAHRLFDSLCKQHYVETGVPCPPWKGATVESADTRSKFSRADAK